MFFCKLSVFFAIMYYAVWLSGVSQWWSHDHMDGKLSCRQRSMQLLAGCASSRSLMHGTRYVCVSKATHGAELTAGCTSPRLLLNGFPYFSNVSQFNAQVFCFLEVGCSVRSMSFFSNCSWPRWSSAADVFHPNNTRGCTSAWCGSTLDWASGDKDLIINASHIPQIPGLP